MKKVTYFSFIVFAIFTMASCNYVDFEMPEDVLSEEESNLVLKSASGFVSTQGTIYVPQGVGIGLKLEAKSSQIKSALWQIEGSNYEGTQVSHKFTSLGEVKIKVKADFDNGTSETRDFVVISVLDISSADPVQVFSTEKSDGTWNVLFLFSKERLRFATSNDYYYNGLVTEWKNRSVPDGSSYILDKNGRPEKTSDVGKYVGVTVNLKVRGLYNIVLIHSGDNWMDLSGSRFIKADNPGLAWFWFEDGEIIPQGDVVMGNLPGKSGDNYFRFSQDDGLNNKVTLFFKLENNLTSEGFVVRELSGGNYSSPISLWSVPEHPNWGQIEVPAEDLDGKISGFRYGPDKNKPTVFSANMKKSFFYDDFFKNLRLSIYKI